MAATAAFVAAATLAALAASAVTKAAALLVYRLDVEANVALAVVSAARAVSIAAVSPPITAVP